MSLLAAPVTACDASDDGDAFRDAVLDADVSLEDAIDEAEMSTPTSVAVDGVFVLEDGEAYYEIILQDGDVERVVRVEAMRAGRDANARGEGRTEGRGGSSDRGASEGRDAAEGRDAEGRGAEGRGAAEGRGGDATRRGAVLNRRRLAQAIRDTCRAEGEIMVGARLQGEDVELDMLGDDGERSATERGDLGRGREGRGACERQGSRGGRDLDRGSPDRGGEGPSDDRQPPGR